MKRWFKTLSISLSAALLLISFSIMGCSRGPNEKELGMLEEGRQAAMSAQEKLSDCQSERQNLQDKVALQKKQLEEAQQEQQQVQQRLQEFGS